MSVLAPLFLLALAGLAVPVLIHLTRHERGKPVRFASLMFLERIAFEETSRRRVRHWALLVLRLGAFALLVVAFARPFVERGRLAAAGGPGPEEVVLLLDRSYSMEREGQWDEALERSREVVRSLGTRDRLTLIAFAETPTVLHSSGTDVGRIRATLDTLSTTALATRLAPAIKLAASTLAASTLPRRRVVVVSDFQRTAWRRDPDATLPAGTVVEAIAVGEEEAENLALVDLELERRSDGERERVVVGARVVNTGTGARDADVFLAVDGQQVDRTSVTVAAGSSETVAFDPVTLANPFTPGEVRIPGGLGGALAMDDALSFVASPGGALTVLVVDPAGTGDSNLYLRRALGVGQGAGFSVRVRRTSPGADDLDGADVVVLNGAPFPAAESGSRLRDFVESGGGLLVVLGERSLVPEEHAGVLPAAVGRTRDAPAQGRRLGFVDYDHQVFEVFRGAGAGDFARASFFRTRDLRVTDGRVLARFDDGAEALVEGRRGQGRVLVWASGLDRYWNNLALQSVYLPFLHRMVSRLGGRSEMPEWHLAGAAVDLEALAQAAGLPGVQEDWVAMGPEGRVVPLATPLLRPDARGIWEIRPPGERVGRPMALAVNVDVRESEVARLDIEEFLAATGARRANAAPANGPDGGEGDASALELANLEGRQSFWRYILAAAFVLLVAETFVSNRLSREQVKGRVVRV